MAATPVHLGPVGWTAIYLYQTAGYLKFPQGDC